jgi:hypothetical protein
MYSPSSSCVESLYIPWHGGKLGFLLKLFPTTVRWSAQSVFIIIPHFSSVSTTRAAKMTIRMSVGVPTVLRHLLPSMALMLRHNAIPVHPLPLGYRGGIVRDVHFAVHVGTECNGEEFLRRPFRFRNHHLHHPGFSWKELSRRACFHCSFDQKRCNSDTVGTGKNR